MPHTLAQLFPELGWTSFASDELDRLLRNLDRFGPRGAEAARYLRERSTRFGYFPQPHSGAGWTLRGNLILPPASNLDDPRIHAVLVHEVLHLRQPLALRLSIRGELLGWQLEYLAYHDATGRYYGEPGAPFPGTAAQWAELSTLSPLTRSDLSRAQLLMKQISPRYRAHLLPLKPFLSL